MYEIRYTRWEPLHLEHRARLSLSTPVVPASFRRLFNDAFPSRSSVPILTSHIPRFFLSTNPFISNTARELAPCGLFRTSSRGYTSHHASCKEARFRLSLAFSFTLTFSHPLFSELCSSLPRHSLTFTFTRFLIVCFQNGVPRSHGSNHGDLGEFPALLHSTSSSPAGLDPLVLSRPQGRVALSRYVPHPICWPVLTLSCRSRKQRAL